MLKFFAAFFLGLVLLNAGNTSFIGLLLMPAGLVLMAWSGVKIFKGFRGKGNAVSQDLPDHVKKLRFMHSYQKTAIAIDTERREVHLKEKSNYKVYRFDEIRSWESNTQSGGMIYGGGINALAANLANERANKENTGLFIKVKDLDFPQWKIDFPRASAKQELTRWMEILQQTLNESTV